MHASRAGIIGGLALLVLTLTLTLTLILVVSLMSGGPGVSPPWLRAGSAAEIRNAGVVYVDRAASFVVFDGKGFLGLSARSPHLGHGILYCPSSGWFEDPYHAEKFDGSGNYRAGPAPRGMDRIEVVDRDGEVFLNARRVTEGQPRASGGGRDGPLGAFCTSDGGGIPREMIGPRGPMPPRPGF